MISGIHGRPYQTWPQGNDEIPERPGKGGFRGFCTHTSILFLTWHRPYLSLFESALREHVKAIALGISDGDPAKSEYLKLAEDFRMPYWDWADNRVMLFPPQALTNADAAKGPPSKGSVNHKYNPLFAAPLKAIGVTDRAILNVSVNLWYKCDGHFAPFPTPLSGQGLSISSFETAMEDFSAGFIPDLRQHFRVHWLRNSTGISYHCAIPE